MARQNEMGAIVAPRRGRGLLLIGASLLGLLAPAGMASAQQAPAEAASADAVDGVEVITVTARRRAESLQDTPIAISAVTSEG
ncbi:hypothetical protein ACFSTI_21405 [Rhizorhabdus histidinilytica]